ncbi:GntR family transcriptional regulator [Streptomyces albidus (ex Kaewkla and Franco 2022)]|uniref:GntR family transcriptional regulator n=1 Tax=Streptomyces albidus (ex Kaewkla and Franco 2022) TaxID=722709 RepID=UPI0015EEA5AE|nr:GntR family transcriptional regulator [Streptomyces albidus (ex Kaewkla and Franco 2022)]
MDRSDFPPQPTAKQIASTIRDLIQKKRTYAPGQRLPAARELAKEVGVQLNTVQSAYGQLRDEGLLLVRQGSGTFVRDPSMPLGTEEGSSPAFTALARELSGIHDALHGLGERLERLERLANEDRSPRNGH